MEKNIFRYVLVATSLIIAPASVTFVSAETLIAASNQSSLATITEQNQPVMTSRLNVSNKPSENTTQYHLGTGDRVKITVYGHPDLSGEFQLDGGGRISLPLIKEILASGQSAANLETAIAAKLSPDYLIDPKVSVEVLNYRPFYIIGEVKKPGSYPYISGMSVLTAVALAGGYTYRAKNDKAWITHQKSIASKSTSSKTDLSNNQKVDAQQNTLVQPGDVIEIPEKYWLF